MAKTTQFVLVCYDIPDDRLLKKLGRLVDKTEDSVRFYFLCESCLPKALAMGAETEMGDARVVARIL